MGIMKTPPLNPLLLHESVMKLEESPPTPSPPAHPLRYNNNPPNSDKETLYLLVFVGKHAAQSVVDIVS